jgi:penicillin-binding protein 2
MSVRLAIKDHIRESRLFNERAATATVIVVLLMFALITRFVYLQILSHEHFSTLSDDNRISIVPVPPTRGLIYDRNGVLIAQNLPSFSLEIVPEQVTDIDATLKELADLIHISDDDINRFYRQLDQNAPFNSIPVRFHLSDEEVARFAAVHAIGYVGRINEDELRTIDSAKYSGTQLIGKTGVEKYYEDILHGNVGFKRIETNAYGRTIRTLERTASQPGKNLYLTLDIQLQRVAEKALDGERGAIVALDPRNGDILAFVSKPGFDPNPFVIGIDPDTFDELQHSTDKPLFNRVLKGQYPPGSTLKPFIGLAGLEYEKTGINTTSFCPGWFTLPGDDRKYRDWKRQGHGVVNLDKAIVESCDVFFYDLALTLGIDNIHEFLSQFGFGQRTGVDLTGELSGLLPSREWKRKQHHQPWYPGETLITGIGQGYTLVTPLQLASATAILANRGVHRQPRIVYATQKPDSAEMSIRESSEVTSPAIAKAANWEFIINSMRRVVHSLHGTAHGISHNLPYKMAGKTGTAQVFGIKEGEEYVKEDVSKRLRDHALFIAFAPVETPHIVIAVIVENGGGGASVAAPIARKVIDKYMQLNVT